MLQMGGPSASSSSGAASMGSFSAVQNLIKPFIGVGILAMPAMWAKGGLIGSSVLLILLTIAATWCILRLVECTDIMMRCQADHHRRCRLARDLESGHHKAGAVAVAGNAALNGSVSTSAHGVAVVDYSSSNDELLASVAESVPFFDYSGGNNTAALLPPSPAAVAASQSAGRDTADDDSGVPTAEDWASVTTPTFTEVGLAAFGPWGGFIVDFSIIITQFGGCIAYLIFVANNMHDLTGVSHIVWIAIMFPILSLLCFVRRTDTFAPVSAIANIVYLYTIAVLFYSGSGDCCVPREELNLFDWAYLPSVFGVCSFSLEGIALIIPVKTRMKDQSKFTRLMAIAGASVGSLYLTMAVSGYLFFGNDVEAPVLNSLPKGWLADSVKIALSLSVFFTFVLLTFPGSELADAFIDRKLGVDLKAILKSKLDERAQARRANTLSANSSNSSSDGALTIDDVHILIPDVYRKRYILQNVARVLFVAICAAVAIVFPNFQLIIMLFGSFTLSLLAYILPPLFWLRVASATRLLGIDYFPFSRQGKALGPHPAAASTADSASDRGHGASAVVASRHGRGLATSAAGQGFVDSSPSAAKAAADGADDGAALFDIRGRAKSVTACRKVGVMGLAVVVAVVGILASVVGITQAVVDIKNELA